jgi:ABC-2 type transport system ATP-binding protein
LIEVEHLTKSYGSKLAVDDLSFCVRPGVVTGFLGPNGAGKSTTMRLILGLDRAERGWAKVNGKRLCHVAAPMHEIGALLEARGVDHGRSARNHLRALGATIGVGKARVEDVLAQVGLERVANQRADQFSLGMSQRLGLAGALLGDPAVVMLDEPANGLDATGISWIRTLLAGLAAEGRCVFLSSHLMSEIELIAEHLIVIGGGKLLCDESMGEFIARNSRLEVDVVAPEMDRLVELVGAAGGTVMMRDGNEIRVAGLVGKQIGELASGAGLTLWELRSVNVSLEEAFMEITRGSVEFGGVGELSEVGL